MFQPKSCHMNHSIDFIDDMPPSKGGFSIPLDLFQGFRRATCKDDYLVIVSPERTPEGFSKKTRTACYQYFHYRFL